MRRLAYFGAGFSGGVFLARYFLSGSQSLLWGFLALALGCAALALPWEPRRRAVILLAALAVGLGYDWLYVRQVQAKALTALEEGERAYTVTLLSVPEESEFGARAEARLEGFPGKIVYYGGRELLNLRPGQTLTGPLRLGDASRIRDEDITAFSSKGVFLLAYGGENPLVGTGTMSSIRWLPLELGRAMREEIGRLFGEESAGFLSAILTGDRSSLSERAEISLSEAGLSHILAVSGMHCAMLLALVTGLIGKHRRWSLFFCAAPLLALYTLVTGCSPSALRACMMLTLLLAGPLFRRESDGPTSLLAALMLILLANPFAAASVGLQLSFSSMAGIIWLTPRLWALVPETWTDRGLLRAICLSLTVTGGALVFAAPLSAWYFGSLSLVTPLSALLCLPAASAAFGFGLLAALAGLVCPPLGCLLALPAEASVRYILGTAGLLAKLPGHGLYFANPYLKYWLVYVYALFAAVFLMHWAERRNCFAATVLTRRAKRRNCFAAAVLTRRARRRNYIWAAALAVLTLIPAVRLGEARCTAGLHVTVLDVGQGQSVILASGGAFVLVDCGSGSGWKDAGALAANQLRAMGCGELDALILTHWDRDHVSGVTGLLARMGTDVLLAPEGEGAFRAAAVSAAEDRGAGVRQVTRKETIPFGAGTLTIFPPLGETGDNERGLTVLASVGDQDFLITGDMSEATERRLLETYDLPDVEGMMAGHHGSRYATSQALLEAVTPETVCISVGSNVYGHPAQETIDRLARLGCAVCRTDWMGNLYLSWNQEG